MSEADEIGDAVFNKMWPKLCEVIHAAQQQQFTEFTGLLSQSKEQVTSEVSRAFDAMDVFIKRTVANDLATREAMQLLARALGRQPSIDRKRLLGDIDGLIEQSIPGGSEVPIAILDMRAAIVRDIST